MFRKKPRTFQFISRKLFRRFPWAIRCSIYHRCLLTLITFVSTSVVLFAKQAEHKERRVNEVLNKYRDLVWEACDFVFHYWRRQCVLKLNESSPFSPVDQREELLSKLRIISLYRIANHKVSMKMFSSRRLVDTHRVSNSNFPVSDDEPLNSQLPLLLSFNHFQFMVSRKLRKFQFAVKGKQLGDSSAESFAEINFTSFNLIFDSISISFYFSPVVYLQGPKKKGGSCEYNFLWHSELVWGMFKLFYQLYFRGDYSRCSSALRLLWREYETSSAKSPLRINIQWTVEIYFSDFQTFSAAKNFSFFLCFRKFNCGSDQREWLDIECRTRDFSFSKWTPLTSFFLSLKTEERKKKFKEPKN